MGKLVVMDMVGKFDAGFSVSLKIWQENLSLSTSDYVLLPIAGDRGNLPKAPNLLADYRHWQALYRSLEPFLLTRALRPLPGVTHASERTDAFIACRRAAQVLEKHFNDWLNSPEFRPLQQTWLEHLTPSEEIRVLLQTDNIWLQRFPWHQWDFLAQTFTKTEIGLSSPKFKGISSFPPAQERVRILAILGDQVDSQLDVQAIKELANCQVTWLEHPKIEDLNQSLWEKPWDILFFAGHSYSSPEGQKGAIKINSEDWLTIADLRNHLRSSIELGLRLAIFNSCDGLGLAYQLSEGEALFLPQVIVMRENLPVQVAPKFLRYLLEGFTEGESLFTSVRKAREKLHLLEKNFPCASWLPVICQNPAAQPLIWPIRKSERLVSKLVKFAVTSLIITLSVMGMRSLGLIQSWELKAFDQLVRTLPSESKDQRLVIIGADEEDLSRYGYPIPDQIIVRLLEKLKQYQSAAVGLDLIRDRPVPKSDFNGHQAFVTFLQQNKNIITICSFNDDPQDNINPPSPSTKIQVGFVDLFDDRSLTNYQDDTVRRYLLSRSPNSFPQSSHCQQDKSFAWKLIYRYLKAQNITVETFGDDWKFGAVVAKPLQNGSGGYQKFDDRGNQLLINYRRTPDLEQLAPQFTVRDVLESNNFDPVWVRNRVVLIGVTAASVKDSHRTPYGRIRGVYLHGHVVSQILSAVEDDRSLWWWWPQWGDFLWILFWSSIGTVIFWQEKLVRSRIAVVTISVIVLLGLSWLILAQNGWIPFIPAILALVSPSIIVVFYRARNSK